MIATGKPHPGTYSDVWWSTTEFYLRVQSSHMLNGCINFDVTMCYMLQVIYFPDRWWHATLNLDSAVFMSTFYS